MATKLDKKRTAASAATGSAAKDWANASMEELTQCVQVLSADLAHSNRERLEEKLQHKSRVETLHRSMSQKQNLAIHLMATQEEERAAVAQEIHEELGQMLAAIQLNVVLMTNEYGDHDQFAARTAAIKQLLATSIMKVQKISSELRPVMLDLLGLADAMEWYAQKFMQKTGTPCRAYVHLREKMVRRELSTSVFRIFQEVLTNIASHAEATSVQVELTDRKGALVLMVCDDGKGISTSEKKNHLSFGIAAMRQRAEAFGGKLRIFGIDQRGTALIVRIPLTRKEIPYAR